MIFQIILGDCFKTLAKFTEQGHKVDYIFGDLTDIPISTSLQGDEWDFVRSILNTSLSLLKPSGKYMTHVSF